MQPGTPFQNSGVVARPDPVGDSQATESLHVHVDCDFAQVSRALAGNRIRHQDLQVKRVELALLRQEKVAVRLQMRGGTIATVVIQRGSAGCHVDSRKKVFLIAAVFSPRVERWTRGFRPCARTCKGGACRSRRSSGARRKRWCPLFFLFRFEFHLRFRLQ